MKIINKQKIVISEFLPGPCPCISLLSTVCQIQFRYNCRLIVRDIDIGMYDAWIYNWSY